jgi:hypothetical protein
MIPRLYLALAIFAAVAVFTTGYLLKRDARVEQRTVAKIEKATTNAVKKGKRAAERSSAVSVRGVRDPSTVHD